MASSSQSAIPDAVDPSTEAENMPSKSVKGSDNANMSDPQPNANQKISNSTTEAENKDVDGSENANKLGQQPSDNQKISNFTTEAENKDIDGSENANKLGQQTVNQEISESTIPAHVDRHSTGAENDNGSENAMMLEQQLTVNKEISEFIIPDLVNRLTEAWDLLPQNVTAGHDNAKMLDHLKKLIAGLTEIKEFFMNSGQNSAGGAQVKTVLERIRLGLPINLETDDGQFDELNGIFYKLKGQVIQKLRELTIPQLVDRISTKAEKVFVFPNMLDDLKKLTAGLKEIRDFSMNSGHNTAEGPQFKTDSARILHEPSYALGTDDGNEVASQAAQLKAKLDDLNGIVSDLKHQEISKSTTILDSVVRLTNEAENLLLPMMDHLKKLIAGVKETREFFTNSGHKTAGAFVKTVLEWILLEPSYRLGSQEVALTTEKLKPKLDELNWIVSKLKLQLPVDSVSTASLTVSKINETIIPAVVARLELAKKYSLSQHPPHDKNDSIISGKESSSHSSRDDYKSTGEQAQKLANDLSYIRSFLKNLEDNSNNSRHRLGNLEGNASVFVNALLQHSAFDDLGTDRQAEAPSQLQEKLRVLNKVVIKLKHQISSPNKLSPTDSDADWYKQVIREFDYSQVLDILPVLHVDKKFKNSRAFRDFREVYESLDVTQKMCCLCFAVIPENEEVKKRFMTHWWVGEGFVSPPVEKAADEIFQELVKKNCIEPVDEKFKSVVNSYKMNPFIRSALIVLAKEARFFDFDEEKGNPSANCTSSYRACLVDGFYSQGLFKSKNESKGKSELKSGTGSDAEGTGPAGLDAEKLQVIFNVNEPYPDVFELEWFSKLKNVKVLYLGRWQTSAKHHIEVESTEFLTGLKSMKLLWFFSLQGISRITRLPDSVCKLLNLRILDLRACHNLEALPDGIGSLKNLTHLDISECYLLDYMPKGIGTLSELQVLKGFVISNHSSRANCTLYHLSKLEKLRKLGIYTNTETFPEDLDVTILLQFKELLKLTITWGAGAFLSKADSNAKEDKDVAQPIMPATTTTLKNRWGNKNQDRVGAQLMAAYKTAFERLEKLDLKCYPRTTAPSWLLPGKFPRLKKLYIRGGNLQNLSSCQENDKYWPNVEVLRLKFLSELKMDWKKLRSSFPGLIYFEKFKCPKLTYFPCNENGVVWLRKP